MCRDRRFPACSAGGMASSNALRTMLGGTGFDCDIHRTRTGGAMRRFVILALSAALIAVLPVWPFTRHWTYGPAIAVSFLLAINVFAWVMGGARALPPQ